jgi:hypothetical protein
LNWNLKPVKLPLDVEEALSHLLEAHGAELCLDLHPFNVCVDLLQDVNWNWRQNLCESLVLLDFLSELYHCGELLNLVFEGRVERLKKVHNFGL